MKKWPKTGPASFEELTIPCEKAILFAYSLNRKNENKDIPWTGLPKGRHELVSTFPPEEALSAENLRYSYEEQGRSALREILAIQAQLAFEQERRIMLDRLKPWLLMIELKMGNDEYTKPIKELFE